MRRRAKCTANTIARTRVLHAGDGSGWAGFFLRLFGSVVKTPYQVNQAVSKLTRNGTFGCLLIDLRNCRAHLVGASLALSESWMLAVRGAVQDVDQSRPSEPSSVRNRLKLAPTGNRRVR